MLPRLQEAKRYNQAIADIPAITMRRAIVANNLQLDCGPQAVCHSLVHISADQAP